MEPASESLPADLASAHAMILAERAARASCVRQLYPQDMLIRKT